MSVKIEPDLPGNSEASQMIWLASAYADAAKVLAESMLTNDFAQHHANVRVILHLCRHALELFLKGAIGLSTGSVPRGTHRLATLFDQYKTLYPSRNYHFAFPFPEQVFFTDDMFPETIEQFHRTHDQRFRYPSDIKGNVFEGFEPFDVNTQAEAIANFWQRLHLIGTGIAWNDTFDAREPANGQRD
ncbi:hypothetical protein [Paraburkholderia saeva]|uniref:Uncharacterized protein n=1 Tax=Paraburkholderia saeva TaxID=2777537 RepID=A0A9N8X271_9BURK|nr:hypothetical protein [Paraburkholderia saeva]CAG4891044.1 hypothetical protein R52603_01088 [Paraburkholderia saeva]CAG4902076.1 hypothetical protein LMG31841_03066 [Paraburkholderia saeva]